jgi:hypothetical protein
LLTLTEDQLDGLIIFSEYVRENDFDREICDYCLQYGDSKKYNKKKCKCQVENIIADFKLYEKLMPALIITELYYYYDPYSRYIYVINQAKLLLKVFDMDELEFKSEEDMDGFDCICEANIHTSPILNIIYLCCLHHKGNYTIDRGGYPFLEAIDKAIKLLFEVFNKEQAEQQLVILFSVINDISFYEHQILMQYEEVRNAWEKIKEYLI